MSDLKDAHFSFEGKCVNLYFLSEGVVFHKDCSRQSVILLDVMNY